MSCQQNSGKAGLAGAGNGIARAAGKAAYAVGAALSTGAGAVFGGAAGVSAGTALGGPGGGLVGGAIGATVGGAAGLGMAQSVKKAISGARAEKAWKASKIGQRAIKTRNTQLAKAKQDYQQQMKPVRQKGKKAREKYETARKQWLAANTGLGASKSVKEAAASPEARAVGASLMAGAANVARNVAMQQRAAAWTSTYPGSYQVAGPTGKDVGRYAKAEALRQSTQYDRHLAQAKEQAWLKSPEGVKAKAAYDKTRGRLKPQKQQATANYARRKETALARYNTARANFMAKYA